MKKNNPQHGGKRTGAGRKTGSNRYKEPTKPIRVPLSLIDDLEDKLNDLAARQVEGAENISWPSVNPRRIERPLFGSRIAAGFPSPADDYIEGQLDLNEHFIKRPSSTFFVRVAGDSMRGAGIFPDDLLIVDRSREPKHKNIVIAVVDGELTVKRLYKRGRKIELHPENPSFPIIQLDPEAEFNIWGVVSGVTRKL